MIPGPTDVILKDCELLELVQRGDQHALVALYDRYSKLVYSVSLRVLRDPVSAEDVMQEIFMQLWRSPQQVPVVGETLHGWLIIASRNRSISVLRKNCSGPLDHLVLTSPFNLERYSERRLMCEKLVVELSPEQRLVLEMAYLNEMSHSDIASATGCPLGTIKSRIRSALKILRKAQIPRPAPIDGGQKPLPIPAAL